MRRRRLGGSVAQPGKNDAGWATPAASGPTPHDPPPRRARAIIRHARCTSLSGTRLVSRRILSHGSSRHGSLSGLPSNSLSTHWHAELHYGRADAPAIALVRLAPPRPTRRVAAQTAQHLPGREPGLPPPPRPAVGAGGGARSASCRMVTIDHPPSGPGVRIATPLAA
jgi:hypothetical protein